MKNPFFPPEGFPRLSYFEQVGWIVSKNGVHLITGHTIHFQQYRVLRVAYPSGMWIALNR